MNGPFVANMDEAPPSVLRRGPSVGDVFRKDGGPAGFMVVVSDNGSTFGLLNISPEGEIVGVGTANGYYFSRRCYVGRCHEMPQVRIDWEPRP